MYFYFHFKIKYSYVDTSTIVQDGRRINIYFFYSSKKKKLCNTSGNAHGAM
jgi:hypothetical protein